MNGLGDTVSSKHVPVAPLLNRASAVKMLGSAIANDRWLQRVSNRQLSGPVSVLLLHLARAMPQPFEYFTSCVGNWSRSCCTAARRFSTIQIISSGVTVDGNRGWETPDKHFSPDRKVTPRPYYFDYQATTPLDPRVLDKMMLFNVDCFANAHSSSHAGGWEAKREVELAR